MSTTQAHGIDAVTAFLDAEGVRHEVVEHRPTFSAAAEARASGAEPREAAKTLALRDHDEYRMAVIPATHRLDLARVRELLGCSGHLRLATEAELEQDFPMFDVGAMPPLGADDADAGDHRRPPALPRPDRVRRRRSPALAEDGPARSAAGLRAAGGGICESSDGRSRFRDLPRI